MRRNIVLTRAIGCFKGVMTGDAVGKQTESLDYCEIKNWYPGGITGFHGEAGTVIPRYAGKRCEWLIGETTDDTEQTIAVAKVIAQEKHITHGLIGEMLMLCRKSSRPTLSLGKFQQTGDPNKIVYNGDGCGASMRVAPIGVLYPVKRLNELVSAVFESCIPTHGGQIAICSASAVAAAVSAAIDGYSPENIINVAVQAAAESEKYREAATAFNVSKAIKNMYNDLSGQKTLSLEYMKDKYFPGSIHNIVPLAICLAVITGSAEATALIASNLGGDTDSVASMGAAIAGAMHPETINDDWYNVVAEVNGTELLDLVQSIVNLRR